MGAIPRRSGTGRLADFISGRPARAQVFLYTEPVSERGANDFRERARVEADRYGPDPWIFVRELLQNARDAGASKVVIEVEERGAVTRISCRDDGEGMTYEHARRYLFSLYASSKEDRANQVGRFGVGFWSILRFDPARIIIRSRPREAGPGEAWQVILDGALQTAERSSITMAPGTEIILERPAGDGSDDRRVFEAAHQNARFLCCRDAPAVPLPITVNGRLANAEFALAPPNSAFHSGHVRGVVGLGNAPRVELFSRGLRVRSAACLDDLLTSTGHTGHSRVRFPELPGGLAPQALLESDGLELMLSRSDARDTRTLRRLVRLGQNELRQLVERQLARIRPPGIGERLAGLMRRLAGESAWWRAVLGAATGAVLALLLAQLIWPSSDARGPLVRGAQLDGARAVDRTVYGDLRKRYHGPQVSELDPTAAEPLALRYQPLAARPYFAAVIIEEVTGHARTTAPLTTERYPGQVCEHECLTVELPIAGSTELPLPIPSGHRLDVASLEFAPLADTNFVGELVLGQPDRVFLSRAGEAMLVLDWPMAGTLRYRTGPGPAVSIPPRREDALPEQLREQAQALRKHPEDERIEMAIDLVRELVRYETSRTVAFKHQQAVLQGKDFVTRTLEIGAGDCDIQNGLLVAILHAAEIDARLAVGWVGHDGGVSAWLHAWVEYLGPDHRWHVADATARAVAEGTVIAGLPPAPDGVAVGTLDRPTGDPEPPDSGQFPSDPSPGGTADPSNPASSGASAGTNASESNSGDRLPPAVVELLSHTWVPWLAFGSGLLGLAFLGVSLSRRTARRFSLDEGGDLSSLLQGALAQPAAFRHLPALFYRRLIPVRGGSAISLTRARTLASEGRLYSGREQTELSQAARRRGIAVLDSDTPEGRTVAAALGATDLDRWGRRLERATEAPVLGVVTAYLREHNERWRCAALRGLGDKIATLDLQPLGAGRRLGDRLVLIDADDPWLLEAERMRSGRPHGAAFMLLDHILDHLELGSDRRAQLLAPLAGRAVDEAAALVRHGRSIAGGAHHG
jgi:transglutaminase-like putative cysteine protease